MELSKWMVVMIYLFYPCEWINPYIQTHTLQGNKTFGFNECVIFQIKYSMQTKNIYQAMAEQQYCNQINTRITLEITPLLLITMFTCLFKGATCSGA
jgi:hypothetical protein